MLDMGANLGLHCWCFELRVQYVQLLFQIFEKNQNNLYEDDGLRWTQQR